MGPNKTHGCDAISVHMLTLCATSISKPLHILFNNSVINERFTDELKKANIILVHKRGDRVTLVIVAKFLKILSLTLVFKYLEDNKLLNCN